MVQRPFYDARVPNPVQAAVSCVKTAKFPVVCHGNDDAGFKMHALPLCQKLFVRPDDIFSDSTLSHCRRFRKITDNALYRQSGAVYRRFCIQAVRQYVTGKIIHLHISKVIPVGQFLSFLRDVESLKFRIAPSHLCLHPL